MQTENKLELLLDDFTDVHGTVLLGMHRELVSLKEDIDDRLDSRISQALAPIAAADAELQAQLEAARQVVGSIDAATGRAALTIDAAREQLGRDIAAARETLSSEYLRISEEFTRQSEALRSLENGAREFAEKQREAHEEIAASRSEFQQVLAQIGGQRSTFAQEINQAMARMAALQQEQQTRMSVSLKVTDKLNSDSRALLKSFRKRVETLQQRDATLHKRRLVEIIVVGVLALSALAVWLWPTLLP